MGAINYKMRRNVEQKISSEDTKTRLAGQTKKIEFRVIKTKNILASNVGY